MYIENEAEFLKYILLAYHKDSRIPNGINLDCIPAFKISNTLLLCNDAQDYSNALASIVHNVDPNSVKYITSNEDIINYFKSIA